MKYIHLRNKDANGNLMKKGGLTIGYELLAKATEDKGAKYLVSFARCSELDDFIKEKSRLICMGRARKGVKVREVQLELEENRFERLVRESMKWEMEMKAKRVPEKQQKHGVHVGN